MAKDPNKIDWSKVTRDAQRAASGVSQPKPPSIPSPRPIQSEEPLREPEQGTWLSDGPFPHPMAERLQIGQNAGQQEDAEQGNEEQVSRYNPFTGETDQGPPPVREARREQIVIGDLDTLREHSRRQDFGERLLRDQWQRNRVSTRIDNLPESAAGQQAMLGNDQVPGLLAHILTQLELMNQTQLRILQVLEEQQDNG